MIHARFSHRACVLSTPFCEKLFSPSPASLAGVRLQRLCVKAEDFVALAREALKKPADKKYAREVLGKAEMQCQFPADYMRVAELAGTKVGDKRYAQDLYQQAEDACFEAKEFAELGHSMAVTLGDKEKARALRFEAHLRP